MKLESIITGIISITSMKSGFVSSPDTEEDVYIPFQFLNTAFHGDEVEVLLSPRVKGEKPGGEVLRVKKRRKLDFVGTVERKKGNSFAFLVPDDPKTYFSIFIPRVFGKLRNNDKALVRISKWDNSQRSPIGELIKIIGKKGDNEAEIESMVIGGGFDMSFPETVLRQASVIDKSGRKNIVVEARKRKDLRGVTTFTIDPETAKDFDDAVSLKKMKNGGLELGVHIADVGFYVKENTALDNEAKKRSFSIYLPDRTIPMLPEALSGDLCSLKPREDRLCFSVIFNITPGGEIGEKPWIEKTIINSNQIFSYKEVQNIVDGKIKSPFEWELKKIMNLSLALRKKRKKAGAIDIDQEEITVDVDRRGKVLSIRAKERLDSHKMIEELMLLANKKIAEFFGRQSPTIFRIHERPEKGVLTDLSNFLKGLGYPIKNKEQVSSHDLNHILDMIKGKDEEFLVKSVLVRSLPKAIYSSINKGHFALAFESYTHFTSPIRRYADLMIHRLLMGKISGKRVSDESAKDLKETARHITDRESELASLERASIAHKQVEYMMDRKGIIYKGVISGITKWGIYVQELETKAEGMVRLKDMKNDFYEIDSESFSIIGRRSKKRYSLGDKVKIKVVDGDVEKKTLDYVFV